MQRFSMLRLLNTRQTLQLKRTFLMKLLFLGTLLTVLCSLTVHAQDGRIDTGRNAAPIDFADAKQPIGKGVGKAGSGSLGSDGGEFGEQAILYRRSNWEPWSIALDFGGFFTDNVALSSSNEVDDSYFRSGIDLGYTPHLKGNLFGDVSLRYNNFSYDELDVLDFDLLHVDAGLLYILPYTSGDRWGWAKRDTTLFSRYQYQQMTESGFGDRFYEEHALSLGAQKTIRIRRGHQAYLGLVSQFAFESEPSVSKRNEYALYAGYQIKWTSQLSTGLQYRGAYFDYTDSDGRNDWNNIVALTAAYQITDWATLKASLSLTENQSNRERFDYSNFSAGGGLSLQVSF
ncbi:MAG: opacity protein-like surface antigen [Verrucomicrobiales bacterium]|jgi:opacity protein-like surface antigen